MVNSEQRPQWVVLKFGGTSVATAASWAVIRDLVQARLDEGLRPVVVHSALGGVSSKLEQLLALAAEGSHAALHQQIVDQHLSLAADLGLDGQVLLADWLSELEQLVAGIRLVREVSHRVHAKVMALGELMATTLGVAYLRAQGLNALWHDARNSLCSLEVPGASERASFLSAMCAYEADPHLQAELGALEGVVLTQGFIASNTHNETVLLGRGGSDTSAAYIAGRLQAKRLEIWTDVPGMFSADPRAVPGARLLKALRYEEAQEIASTGGSVLHPRAISPVRRAGIPLWIRSTARPEATGTVIAADASDDAPRVKAISRRGGITLVSMETLGMWQQVGFLTEAFSCFSDLGLSIDLVSTSESNVTVTLDPGANSMDAPMMERLRLNLERLCRVQILQDVAVVSLVGQKIRAMLHEIGPALEVFQENRIHLLSQAASDLNLSFVVDAEQAPRLVQNLHATLISRPQTDAVFGETWEELAEEQLDEAPPVVAVTPWWIKKRDRLIEIAVDHTSAYVYDLESIASAVGRLRGLNNVDQVFYAIKANSNPDVLRVVHDGGLNFEVVSPGEIQLILELFPDIDPERILFTPNFASRDEYEFGLEQGVWVTLDNLHPLREWGESFAGKKVFLRLDPGQGRGHHEHVKTAGVHSKFGIPLFELEEAARLVAGCGAEVVGLHAHTGSGILQADNWEDVAASLMAVREHFPTARILDLGGGLGIPEKPGQIALDMAALDTSLAAARDQLDGFELWLEPGRYVIAEAGVLLATVTQLKGKGDVQYVGISTGMNSLIRPALYGAYHEIANLSRVGEAATEIVNVVGPICETGDRLGSDRLLPPSREGDIIAIANAGAYGYVMSSGYNQRKPAAEVVI
ncbi:MAG: bifunctional aspartate kinase/diaminopimelate decarboxylase [Gammaproteobacteria bacterium]|nr:bifunctional aspartate kinase/diaminopimelate decarboxylase [Gammaproteobacteria bacterium]MCP4831442.1 bifunctional aspartate kinase/diaminopimelate decarboxylase [Gammaproteobacteria bacterium]